MRIDVATERLLPGEVTEVVSVDPTEYGRVLRMSAFGWRVIVDFISRPSALR